MSALAANSTPNAWLPSGNALEIDGAPDWFTTRQAQAREQYAELGLPGVRDEQWRYTNLRALKGAELNFAVTLQDVAQLPLQTQAQLVFINGALNLELSKLEQLPTGLECKSLAQALIENSDEIEPVLGSTLPAEQHGFHLMNAGYCSDGYVMLVPQGAVIDEPIEVVYCHTAGAVSHTRNIIIAGANSQCTVIERHIGTTGTSYLNNCITEVAAGDGAHLDHYKLHAESDQAFHLGGLFIEQARGSNVSTHNFSLSGGLVRNDITANLAGPGCHVEMNGLVLGTGKQHIDNHTEVVHAEPHCTSDEFYKTILDDNSRSVFRGRIVVAQDAQQTNADQQNNNLLLSANAEADTKPQLEIYADDVKCSHGATVGQLEQKSMFYLQSRGINPTDARALLTFAFANEVLDRIKVQSVRQEMTSLIAGELISDLEDVMFTAESET